jgi:hypothetical protein
MNSEINSIIKKSINKTPDINRTKIKQSSILNIIKALGLNDLENSILELNIKNNFLKIMKNKEKMKRFLYFIKANNLEKDFNRNLENNNNNMKNFESTIQKMKKKYNDLLEEFDKKINFNLEEYIKEYEKKDLGVNFTEFFNYLLIILVNYDKKIIKNTFSIKKESKEQPYDVRYSTVIKRHNKFMNLLEKQFNEGKNLNKLLKKYLLKREEEKKEQLY